MRSFVHYLVFNATIFGGQMGCLFISVFELMASCCCNSNEMDNRLFGSFDWQILFKLGVLPIYH